MRVYVCKRYPHSPLHTHTEVLVYACVRVHALPTQPSTHTHREVLVYACVRVHACVHA